MPVKGMWVKPRFLLGFIAVVSLSASGVQPVVAPKIPLGFEKSAEGYSVQAVSAGFRIGRGGFGILTKTGTMQVVFRRSNPKARLAGIGSTGTLNRFIGNDPALWRTNIPLAGSVEEHDLYRGIDLRYHGDNREFEYDFIVRPGGDPRRIEMEVLDAATASLTQGGDLIIGSFVQHRPRAYQVRDGVRQEVASAFRLERSGRVRFDVGPYDHSIALTIDPLVSYVSYLGGSNADTATSIAVDGAGDIFVAGNTLSTTAGNQNVLLFKLAASGAATQSVFGGTTGADSANAMVLDSSGDVFLAGSTSSNNFPIAGNQFTGVTSGLTGLLNAFVIAFPNTIATPSFSTYIGGNESDQALGIALEAGILYVVGDTNSTSFPEFAPTSEGSVPFQEGNHGGYDAFVLALTTAGVGQFSSYLGGSGDDHGTGVAVNASGYVYVAGSTTSTDFPVSGSTSTVNQGGSDAFVIKLLPTVADGDWGVWSVLVGGSGTDTASGLALYSKNNLYYVYVAGTTASSNFPTTSGVYQTTPQGGDSDGFVFALEDSGVGFVALWSTFLGSVADDALNAIALDSGGNILVTGTTDSTAWPVTGDAPQAANGGGQDAVIVKLNNTGTSLLFSTYLGGSGNEIGTSIAEDSLGRIYVAGTTTSSNNDLPVTANAYQKTYGGGTSDAFFAILGCSASKPAITSGGIGNAASFSTSAISPGAAIAIFGTNLGCTATTATMLPLATSLGGVSVQINGTAAPLFYTSSGQVNAQVPYAIPTGAANVTVTTSAGTSAAESITVVAAGPGIFTANKQAAAINQDGTVNTTTTGAKPGSIVSVYFTGQGPVNPAVATGAAASTTTLSYVTSTPVSATIGSQPAVVQFMGLAPGFVGLAQANLTVPSSLPAGDYRVTITIGAVASQAATMTVSQ